MHLIHRRLVNEMATRALITVLLVLSAPPCRGNSRLRVTRGRETAPARAE
jgi:hypothetical protein